MGAGAVYRLLMAGADRIGDFPRHVLACPLALALGDGERGLDTALGLAADEIALLLDSRFPQAAAGPLAGLLRFDRDGDRPASLEEPDLRALLLAHCGAPPPLGPWLARIIARRSLESNHLWQDLGLFDRSDLSRLMSAYFAPLAAANQRDMKWKKFFYRTLCQQEGLNVCKSPVCDSCSDFAQCFGDEDGLSLLARAGGPPSKR